MDTFPDHSKGQVPDMNHRSGHQQTIPIDEDDLNVHHDAYQDHPNESLPSYEEVASSSSATYNNIPTPPSSHSHTRSAHSVSSISTDSNDPKQHQSGLLSSSTYNRSGGASSNGSSCGAERRSRCGRGSRSGNYWPETRGYTTQQPMSVLGEVDDSKWDAKKGEPGCCFSDSGGCCFSSRGACCFSDRGACCFSDREGCCFSDRKGCCFSDSEGCCCSSGKGGGCS